MKFIELVLISTLATAWAWPLAEKEEEGWLIPQINGESVWTTKSELEAMSSDLPDALFDVNFYLLTRSNPTTGQLLDANNVSSILDSNFRPKLPIFFTIHGWTDGHESPVNVHLRGGYLTALDCNVISVDWSAARTGYAFAASSIPEVGKQVGTFIQTLVNQVKIPLANIRVAGHSLGAHVAGFTGKTVQALMGYSLERIDGMDPALPGFSKDNPAGRLSNKDAKFVTAIHTNGGNLGFLSAIGDADFYMNGGERQPSCLEIDLKCSHEMSHEYLAEATILNSFVAHKCATETDAINNTCEKEYSDSRMGTLYYSDPLPSGSFYVPVRKTSPYGLGA